MFKIIVLISGNGTNLQAIIDAINNNILVAGIEVVISNVADAPGLLRASSSGIPIKTLEFKGNKKNLEQRLQYDMELAKIITSYDADLIVLAGFMHVLSEQFLIDPKISGKIINLHPALPNTFPGAHAIADAFKAFQKGDITKTGIMVHRVIPEVDAGEVLATMEIPILQSDTETSLRARIQQHEKGLLILTLQKLVLQHYNLKINDNIEHSIHNVDGDDVGSAKRDSVSGSSSDNGSSDESGSEYLTEYPKIYSGKVRDIYDVGYGYLAMIHSNRQSAFDRHICDIPDKGAILTAESAFMFGETEDIIDNHYVAHEGPIMIVRKCTPFKMEIIVRQYLAGNTRTSIWKNYKSGVRNFCGNKLPNGLQENQKLKEAIITPTTKGEKEDKLTSSEELIKSGICTKEEWDMISEAAFQLFERGSELAADNGLILVDTKYEFGRDDETDEIILIDELHTIDSSRYWVTDSYEERFKKKQQPEKLDKDLIRDYILGKCDPYTTAKLPEIPKKKIKKVTTTYLDHLEMLTEITAD